MSRPARLTHQHDGDLVVFLIGMRIRRWWRPDKWVPVFLAMPGMIKELMSDPASGMLGYRLVFSLRGPWVVQYWSDHEKLYSYASRPGALHRPAWTAYNRRARSAPGVVGVWHETYVVDRAESIYVDMPAEGLAAATDAVPVGTRTDRAAQRLAGTR